MQVPWTHAPVPIQPGATVVSASLIHSSADCAKAQGYMCWPQEVTWSPNRKWNPLLTPLVLSPFPPPQQVQLLVSLPSQAFLLLPATGASPGSSLSPSREHWQWWLTTPPPGLLVGIRRRAGQLATAPEMNSVLVSRATTRP